MEVKLRALSELCNDHPEYSKKCLKLYSVISFDMAKLWEFKLDKSLITSGFK
jgi:hypothetical protein